MDLRSKGSGVLGIWVTQRCLGVLGLGLYRVVWGLRSLELKGFRGLLFLGFQGLMIQGS
jgi:hypothetical protein